jgi:ABC-2 type transport system ATP-binding protein
VERNFMTHAIETQRLTKYYGTKCVVDSLTFQITPGTVYGLLDRNGAGKSTTIRMLLGMVQPSCGTARLLGHDVAALPPHVRVRIAYLAEGHPLYRWMTVADAVRFSRTFHRDHWNGPMLDQVLDHFELSRRQKIGRLSHGQRAHVALALAITPDPDLLILDDPTLGLDTVARRDFLLPIVQLIQRQGRTILFGSHIPADVERLADRIGILIDGVLRVDCPTEHFKESIRKVVIEFPGRPPTLPACPGFVPGPRAKGHRDLRLSTIGICRRYFNMVLAIVAKEWRETRLLAALALAIYGVYVSKLTGHWNHLLTELIGWLPGLGGPLPDIPFVQDGFGTIYGFVGFSLAIALGFRQSFWELRQGTAPFLLHLPMSRPAIMLTKLLSGAGLLLACTFLPIAIYAAWAAAPGTHPGPFEWSMTGPFIHLWLMLPLVYLGAFASGIRPTRWFGSRLFPLVSVAIPVFLFQFAQRWHLIALPILLLATAAMISNIVLEAETRDFN